MIKKGIIFIIFLIFSTCLSAKLFSKELKNSKENNIFHIDISAGFGMINGSINEFVFADVCKNTDSMLSRLDWDIVTIPYAYLDVSADLFKYLYIGATGRIGAPKYSGVMQDYDWMNSVPPHGFSSWLLDDPAELTNYSKHNNHVDKFYNFSVKAGGNIPICNIFSITPYIGYQYDFIYMSAYDGYSVYKWNNFEKINLPPGKCISYAQEANEFITGIKIKFSGIPGFPLMGDFQVVPGIGKMVALDIHYGRKEQGGDATAFLDIYKSLFMIEGKLSGFYEFNRHFGLGFSSFIQFMPITKGMTGSGIVKNGKLPSVFNGSRDTEGGTKRFMYSISISCKVSF